MTYDPVSSEECAPTGMSRSAVGASAAIRAAGTAGCRDRTGRRSVMASCCAGRSRRPRESRSSSRSSAVRPAERPPADVTLESSSTPPSLAAAAVGLAVLASRSSRGGLAAAGLAGPALALLDGDLLAGRAGLAMVASGLSADNSAQYCSSVSLSHSLSLLLGQSSSSSRLPRCGRERLLLVAGAAAALRRESGRFAARAETAGSSPEAKSSAWYPPVSWLASPDE